MTEEEKAAIAAAGEKADAEADAGEGGEGEADGSSKEDEQIDYEALAKAEAERAAAAEAKLEETRRKAREATEARRKKREEDGEAGEDDEEEKPLTPSQLAQMLDERDQKRDKEAQKERALEIARKNTTSEAEAQAAVLFYQNRIVPTGNLEEDIQFAIGGLNRKRISGQQSEIERARLAKENAERTAAEGHQDAAPTGEAKLPPNDLAAIKAAGMVWDGAKGFYKKPLGKEGKKHLYFDPKTKKRWTA